MQCEPEKRWQELCDLTAKEEDPGKLVHYVQEINRILEEQRKKVEMRREAM